MIFTFMVNERGGVARKQTTLRMVDVALRRGHHARVCDVSGLSVDSDVRPWARAVELRGVDYDSDSALCDLIRHGPTVRAPLGESDALLIRTNPGRDPARREYHAGALRLALAASEQGVVVLNDPRGLAEASSKLYLIQLPEEVRPITLVSGDEQELIEFVRGLDGPAVLKPLCGSRGIDVFLVQSADDPNLRQILEVVLRRGFAMAQEFVPEAVDGDTRVLVVDGELLEVEGRPGAFRRVPGRGDFRSNVDVGGKTAPAVIDRRIRDAVARIGPVVRRDGLFFVGLDFIGGRVIEVNAFSPGGLRAAAKFEGVDFTGAVLDRIERRVANGG